MPKNPLPSGLVSVFESVSGSGSASASPSVCVGVFTSGLFLVLLTVAVEDSDGRGERADNDRYPPPRLWSCCMVVVLVASGVTVGVVGIGVLLLLLG